MNTQHGHRLIKKPLTNSEQADKINHELIRLNDLLGQHIASRKEYEIMSAHHKARAVLLQMQIDELDKEINKIK